MIFNKDFSVKIDYLFLSLIKKIIFFKQNIKEFFKFLKNILQIIYNSIGLELIVNKLKNYLLKIIYKI